jgi:hypothetical protein
MELNESISWSMPSFNRYRNIVMDMIMVYTLTNNQMERSPLLAAIIMGREKIIHALNLRCLVFESARVDLS